MPLDDYRIEPFTHTAASGNASGTAITHDVYRRGTGPCVMVVAEIPGVTPEVIRFADDLIEAGFSVAMPSMFGVPGREPTARNTLATVARVCVSREFRAMATRDGAPATDWLRALARNLHAEHGGPGIGFVGMCFTGGFGLAMLLDDAVIAPVLSQPSLPFGIGRARRASTGLDATQIGTVAARAAEGCAVLGLRFTGDPLVPAERFETLRAALGDDFIAIEIPSPDATHGIGKRAHSVLTEERSAVEGHPTKAAFDQVITFLTERLQPA